MGAARGDCAVNVRNLTVAWASARATVNSCFQASTMKNISLLLLLLCSHFLQAQTTFQRLPYDHIWVLNNSTIDFNFDPPLVELNNSELFFELTNTSICDTSGDIVFYSHNMSIFWNDKLCSCTELLSTNTLLFLCWRRQTYTRMARSQSV